VQEVAFIMRKVVIFGVRDLAELAWFYFAHDSDYEVAAFALTDEYMGNHATFHGLPVARFEDIDDSYSPAEYDFFVPMSARGMNKDREKIYGAAKAKGYRLANYISSKATIFPGLEIGDNCFILEDNTIQPFVEIGSNAVLWSGNHVGHHCVLNSHVFLTSHVVLCGHTNIGSYCFLGVNSSVAEYVKLGEGTFVGMNSSVVMDTDAWGFYKNNPAVKQKKSSIEIM
jgi:sugar O-acyltransferase (sialic acid O-acetyltransferase NeuD family)